MFYDSDTQESGRKEIGFINIVFEYLRWFFFNLKLGIESGSSYAIAVWCKFHRSVAVWLSAILIPRMSAAYIMS